MDRAKARAVKTARAFFPSFPYGLNCEDAHLIIELRSGLIEPQTDLWTSLGLTANGERDTAYAGFKQRDALGLSPATDNTLSRP